ncbi:hypothetical protein DXG01_011389 [Tephrocybe rancida]|nr:hypothetical protein DXG01_011389 [Tephrocybe rancida]
MPTNDTDFIPQAPSGLGYAPGIRNYDYTFKYSRDKQGEAHKENVRVWNVYLNEAEIYEAEMVQGFRNIIDGLLVFAALFSAIVTTFVAQTSQALQLDNTQIMVSLLAETNLLLQAAGNITILNTVLHGLSPRVMTYTTIDAWVNGLFFSSLSLSLSSALLTVGKTMDPDQTTNYSVGEIVAEAATGSLMEHTESPHTWAFKGDLGFIPTESKSRSFYCFRHFEFILSCIRILERKMQATDSGHDPNDIATWENLIQIMSIGSGNMKVMTAIVDEHPTILSIRNADNKTALEHAASSGHFDVVDFLLQQGAERPPHLLYEQLWGLEFIGALRLLEQGWNPFLKDESGTSAFELASQLNDGGEGALHQWLDRAGDLEC